MTLPAIILGMVISSLVGSVFHLWRGGGPLRLILYLALSWIGFWLGHLAAIYLGWTFWSVGPLHLGMAMLGCFAVLGVGYWLSLVQETTPQKPTKKGIR
ncbi:MAG: hypothetical protein ABFD58_07925 [Anaerolineaceae bacterium]